MSPPSPLPEITTELHDASRKGWSRESERQYELSARPGGPNSIPNPVAMTIRSKGGALWSLAAVTGVTPNRVTTDGHDSYSRAIRTELGKDVRHRTSAYLNNRLEQDHRGIKGRYRP